MGLEIKKYFHYQHQTLTLSIYKMQPFDISFLVL